MGKRKLPLIPQQNLLLFPHALPSALASNRIISLLQTALLTCQSLAQGLVWSKPTCIPAALTPTASVATDSVIGGLNHLVAVENKST